MSDVFPTLEEPIKVDNPIMHTYHYNFKNLVIFLHNDNFFYIYFA